MSVLLFTRLASPQQFIDLLGLRFKLRDLMAGLLTGVITWVVAKSLIPNLLAKNHIGLYHRPAIWNWGWCLMPFTQATAEELVLRGLLLNFLLFQADKILKIKILSQHLIALVSGLLFVSWHILFFPLTQGVWLDLSTLITIFAFGYSSSILFLMTQNIAVPLGLHAGWNLVKFSGEFISLSPGLMIVTEADAFNAVEGSWTVLFISVLGIIVCEMLLMKNNNRTKASYLKSQ